MAPTISAGSITTGGDVGPGGTRGSPPAETGMLAAGAHVPILHFATSLLAPTGDVAKVMQLVTLAEQRTQAEQLFAFLSAPIPALS